LPNGQEKLFSSAHENCNVRICKLHVCPFPEINLSDVNICYKKLVQLVKTGQTYKQSLEVYFEGTLKIAQGSLFSTILLSNF